jgi:hypothetical protein
MFYFHLAEKDAAERIFSDLKIRGRFCLSELTESASTITTVLKIYAETRDTTDTSTLGWFTKKILNTAEWVQGKTITLKWIKSICIKIF